MGTSVSALFSRQIAHAVLRLNGAHVQMPLPPLAGGSSSPSSGGAIELVSIDEIRLNDVEIVSGGRTLHADIEAVPQGAGISFQKFALRTDDSHIEVKGAITNLAGPVGDLSIKADTLHLDRLVTFVSGLSDGTSPGQTSARTSSPPGAAAARQAMNVSIALDAPRAMFGTMALDHLNARARITDTGMSLDPMSCELFKGRYEGALALTLGEVPDFQLRANLTAVDVGSAMTFAGSPNTVTGRLSGRVDLCGPRRGGHFDSSRSLHGSVNVDFGTAWSRISGCSPPWFSPPPAAPIRWRNCRKAPAIQRSLAWARR